MSPFTPPVVLTPAQLAANQIVALANAIPANYMRGYNAIWNNPRAQGDPTFPIQVFAALGVQAQAIMQDSAVVASFLISKGLAVPTGFPAGYTGANNPDGSISLTYTAP